MIDHEQLNRLTSALAHLDRAQNAYERRVARDNYEDAARPRLVGQLLDEYLAESPTIAELDDIATLLHNTADRIDRFSDNLPETAKIIAVIAITGDTLERTAPMAFTMSVGQRVDPSVSYTDRGGNPAEVESQQWESTDETVLTVTDNGDGTAIARAAGGTGTAQVTLTADARFGPDVSEIRGVLDVEVVAAEAVNATITPGEPVDDTNGGGAEPTPDGGEPTEG